MKFFIFLTFLLITLLLPLSSAQAITIMPDCARGDQVKVTADLCCALQMVSNLARWILGIMGAAALLFFIYGGFLWITSAGVSGRVQQGQKIMSNTVIGIIIIVLAWILVNFIIVSFADTPKVIKIKGLDTAWYEICKDYNDCQNSNACKNKGKEWNCQHYSSCGLNSWQDCDTASNCEKNLCPGGNECVCCNPE